MPAAMNIKHNGESNRRGVRAALLSCLFAMACVTSTHAEEEIAWRQLFNGTDTSGWAQVGRGEFTIEDGHLVTQGGMGLLWYTEEEFGNCEIKVVFRTDRPEDNSGVFIRIEGKPKTAWHAVHQGYEIQIDNVADEWHRTGALYSLTKTFGDAKASPGEWTELIIRLEGDNTKAFVNGTLVTDYTEGDAVPEKKSSSEPRRGPRPESGYIGLQNHDPATFIHFREVSVRPLSDAVASPEK